MLSELVPGVRELRSALAAGYLWLIFGWLLLHDDIGDAGGPISDLVDLGEAATDVGLGIAASFVAYLVGSLSEDLFLRWFIRWMDKMGLKQRYAGDSEDVERIADAELMREELSRLENSADRAQAEARLRVALVPPLLAIVIYLMASDSLLWAASFIGVVAVSVQAWMRVRDWFAASEKLSGFRSAHQLIEPPAMGSSS